MTTLKKTYRFAAVFTLLLFLGNIVLPAGAAAMNLHCDINNHANTMHDCCDQTEMANHSETENDDCMVLSFCEQVVNSEQSDIPAVLQHTKIVLAADLTGEFNIPLSDDDDPEIFRDQSVQQQYAPPIFLLNSVFLN
ncbi:hypothetical protein [Fodinibius sp.]|uniref:hypothetical protein n=1 Tax=Fodinibius sp. TaxID=1872440 RepID=UPI002ACDA3EA|nr:hypothetical protein [Fodinibius sp.]MDZ7659569.1 hypothetical protein [Fodinibius sp.]